MSDIGLYFFKSAEPSPSLAKKEKRRGRGNTKLLSSNK
jgi:hypothetical protein